MAFDCPILDCEDCRIELSKSDSAITLTGSIVISKRDSMFGILPVPEHLEEAVELATYADMATRSPGLGQIIEMGVVTKEKDAAWGGLDWGYDGGDLRPPFLFVGWRSNQPLDVGTPIALDLA